MTRKRSIIRLATVFLSAALLIPSTAIAQSRDRGAHTPVRTSRPSVTSSSIPSRGAGRLSTPRPQRSTNAQRPSYNGGTSPYSNRSSPSRSSGPSSLGDLIGALGKAAQNHGGSGAYDPRNGYYGRQDDSDRASAEAFRDVGIANAIVDLVGIIANAHISSQNARSGEQSHAVTNQYPLSNSQAAPSSGHYERQQVLIKEGYYEDYQVWVPEYQDPQTGDIVPGHNELHRRWVPPIYGYQDVWVP